MTADEIDQLAAALDAEPTGPYGPRLDELLAVAAELAEVLAAQPLPGALRRRIYRRATEQAGAHGHGVAGLVRRHGVAGAAGGAAALAAAAVAVALLRSRGQHAPGRLPQAA